MFPESRRKFSKFSFLGVAAPEEHIGKLKELLPLCGDKDDTIGQLAMLSLVAIFKDVCPGYKIRLPSEKELTVQVTNHHSPLAKRRETDSHWRSDNNVQGLFTDHSGNIFREHIQGTYSGNIFREHSANIQGTLWMNVPRVMTNFP
jgi:hypothetical protein